ncbi:NAC domain-containing protein 78 [Hordeum vulgare]|nr:NAC domain-containing protein 78 [Hordeum vulgare]
MASVTVGAAAAEMEHALTDHLLPGFRFHPTDQELLRFFLRRKVFQQGHGGFIPDFDLYKFEPHQLPVKSFSPSTTDPEAKVECYFFAPRGRKYPTGLRMLRATVKGFWKSTGKDRPVMHNTIIVGMKKTLVFHLGRAPRGTRTDWVMHEYRLHGDHDHRIQDTYALCRVFNKNMMSSAMNLYGDADTDEDLMQLLPDDIEIDTDLMDHVSDRTGSHEDPKHFVLGGVEIGNDMMQSMLAGVGTYMDPIRVDDESDGAEPVNNFMQSILGGFGGNTDQIHVESVSDAANANMDLMQYTLGGVGTDDNPIHIESMSDEASTSKDMMQFVFGGMGTYKNPIQTEPEVGDGVDTDKIDTFLADGEDTGNVEMQILTDGDNKEQEGMQGVSGGTNLDEDNSENSWYIKYLAEEDNSWTQSPLNDLLYTSDDMGMIQFNLDDIWL